MLAAVLEVGAVGFPDFAGEETEAQGHEVNTLKVRKLIIC